jgi:hypothetical protein
MNSPFSVQVLEEIRGEGSRLKGETRVARRRAQVCLVVSGEGRASLWSPESGGVTRLVLWCHSVHALLCNFKPVCSGS